MNQGHVTENELQQFALLQQEPPPEAAAHIRACARCAAAIANYRAMFTAIGSMEKPVFNFDPAALVMAQLPVAPPKKTGIAWQVPGIIVFSLAVTAIPVFVLRRFIEELFGSTPAPVLYLIGTTALTILLLQGRELLAAYREKMHRLNFY